jgi:hypothetical protein
MPAQRVLDFRQSDSSVTVRAYRKSDVHLDIAAAPMLVFPKTLLEFQRMFPTEEACAEYVLSMRWPKGFFCSACGVVDAWRLDLAVPGLRPADLADRRHGHAQEQAAAHRLVLGRLSGGLAFERHLGPAAPKAARPRELPNRLADLRQATPGDGRSAAPKALRHRRGRRGLDPLPHQERAGQRRPTGSGASRGRRAWRQTCGAGRSPSTSPCWTTRPSALRPR